MFKNDKAAERQSIDVVGSRGMPVKRITKGAIGILALK